MNKLLLICVFLLLAACQQKEAETPVEAAETTTENGLPVLVPVTAEDKEIVKKLGSDNCFAEYKDYLTYKENVAFATSTDGACGYSGELHKSVDEAKKEAVETCETYRDDGEPCKVVNVNGKWQS
jgi:hypothetical protein